jgi:hypothetical protein
LTAFGTTNACGWGVGDAFPLPPCHVANAGFGAEPQGFKGLKFPNMYGSISKNDLKLIDRNSKFKFSLSIIYVFLIRG